MEGDLSALTVTRRVLNTRRLAWGLAAVAVTLAPAAGAQQQLSDILALDCSPKHLVAEGEIDVMGSLTWVSPSQSLDVYLGVALPCLTSTTQRGSLTRGSRLTHSSGR